MSVPSILSNLVNMRDWRRISALMPLILWLRPIIAFLASSNVPSFFLTSNKASSHIIYKSGFNSQTLLFADDDEEIEDFESRRMDIVRNLQKSYYKSVHEEDDTSYGSVVGTQRKIKFDTSTGRVLNLPLWRVGWVETPGRRNCLNVHEGRYTHMFETIISQASSSEMEPLYFGHLYVPGGSVNSRSRQHPLKTWQEELADESRYDPSILNTYKGNSYVNKRAAVVGCLMEIVDYRRMDDGRLMILVQAVERFVVDEIVETDPYAVGNVQILLDEEELPYIDKINVPFIGENACKEKRGEAVSACFYYHDYEFDKPKLPISDNRDVDEESEQYLSKDDVPWICISKLLPFAHYSTDDSSLMIANEKQNEVQQSCLSIIEDASGSLPLEQLLCKGAILWKPTPIMPSDVILRRTHDINDCDTLETLLWLALDDFCRAVNFELPEEISCLLPSEMDYLGIKPKRMLSRQYPKIRRQRRLSYLAPALIENSDVGNGMRQVLLNSPSIKSRLASALERFDYLNNKLMGTFE
jgi:hypothetical protein